MTKTLIERMVRHVNRKNWWHSPPEDPRGYNKRGKFLASTYAEAAFYGRPLIDALRVVIARPVIGHESLIERRLFGAPLRKRKEWTIRAIFALDRRRRNAALRKGYDSIVLVSRQAFKDYVEFGKIPRSIELNILRVE